ncbi:MAG: hypothetical protein K0S36_808 [Nitrosospira multiformis]|jgi:hypothetical protein|nr:hypothetical protein [Nitrosospira multiformis]
MALKAAIKRNLTSFNFFRDSHWALDILNVNTASLGASYISEVPSIPEPESYALLLAGLGLIPFVIQYSSRKQMPV